MDSATADLIARMARVLSDGQWAASESRHLCEISEAMREAAQAIRREMRVTRLQHTRVVDEARRLCRPPADG